ncbi:MAG: VWA domain-containing protein [Pseudomonadales bacterium]
MSEMASEVLSNLHFLRPWWLLAVIPALLLAFYWVRRRASGSHWESSIAPELLAVLLERGGSSGARRLPWLVAAGLCAAAVGLAGPTWERLPQPVEQKADSLVILFDLSLSMYAEDVKPSRVVRARQKIADVLRRREEGFTALIAYAGDAHAVVPLTDDIRTIENLLPALRPDMMPVLGSDLGEALDLARELFANAGVRQGRILVITDAVDQMSAATERRDPSFPISVLGVGTAAGATIPLDFVNQPGQVLRSQQGEPILARLDETRLGKIAELTFGRYQTLSLSDADIERLLATPLPGEDDTTEVERDFDTWADRGYWVLVLLLPLALASFRRGALAVVALTLLPGPADAGIWDDLWQRRDQQAFEALRDGEPEIAAVLFEQQPWRAAALYRSGEFGAAADTYRQQPSTTARYNLGNALARQGDYQAAIDAYDAVLAEQPDHEDARFNKALVEKLLEQQNQAQENEQAQQQQGEQPEQDTESQDGGADQAEQNDQDGQPPEDQQDQPEEQPSEAEQNQDTRSEEELAASRDERQDALEQWLRRVPDDPGGLLRRKFQYETNQRLRRGDYRSQETEKIW